jgi:membrane-bound lytic murein transglycosylase D
MHGLRRLKLWALAATVTMAAGCAAVPASNPSLAVLPTPALPAASASADAASAPAIASASAAQLISVDPMELQAALQEPADPAAAHYGDIWQRVRAGFAIPDMNDPAMQPYVQQALQWYQARPDYVGRMTERSRRYLYYIVQEVQRRNMPTELALLPFIESAFNPGALSPANASGMWQFIPSTGKNYNLKQNMFADGRRDVMASTKAALDYLTKLHDMFGDWQLALAAYNWGEGGVQRAINNNLARGLPVDYASLNMPAETRNYYPKLQAVKEILSDPAKYGINLPDVPDHPYFQPVTVTQDVDVNVAVKLAGVSMEEFRALNPSFNKPVILAAASARILLPYDNATAFEQALANPPEQLASWTTYAVRKTATPSQIARDLHLTETTLRSVNNIPLRTLVKAGSTLLVPRTAEDDRNVSEHVVDNAVLALAPDAPAGHRLRVKTGRSDTPQSIAKRYGLNAEDVARWNHLDAQGRFPAHATIVVYTTRRAGAHPTLVADSSVHRHGAGRIDRSERKPLRYSIRAASKRDIRVAQR